MNNENEDKAELMRQILFGALDNLDRITQEMEKKDRTSKKEVKILVKDIRHNIFEALKRVKGV
jgi:hypothetical protein